MSERTTKTEFPRFFRVEEGIVVKVDLEGDVVFGRVLNTGRLTPPVPALVNGMEVSEAEATIIVAKYESENK